ncbi:MAG: hypothetical protein WB755_21700, partial [Terriglobales bacterium]
MRCRCVLALSTGFMVALSFAGVLPAGQENSQSSSPESHGVDLTSLDKTCKPCQDFYHYANGEWQKRN